MSKRNKSANAGPAKPDTGNPAPDQPQAAGAQAAAADGGAPTPTTGGDGGGDGAAGPETEAVTITVLDPDGNAPSGEDPRHVGGNVFSARIAAVVAFGVIEASFPSEAAIVLASFFRTFPDSPDQAGPTELKRFRIDLPEEDRPGQLLAMVKIFRCALDQLDRLDREDAARAEAAKPKPKPEQWREPKGFKQTKQAMQPGSGMKPRR